MQFKRASCRNVIYVDAVAFPGDVSFHTLYCVFAFVAQVYEYIW